MQIWKNIIKPVIAVVLLLQFFSCSNDNQTDKNDVSSSSDQKKIRWSGQKSISGYAEGTTFTIKTSDDSLLTNPTELQHLFDAYDLELSTYNDQSVLTRFNNEDSTVDLNKTEYFKTCFEESMLVYKETNGYFDPTVFPLVKLWGFFKKDVNPPSQHKIDSVLQFIGFKHDTLYTYKNGIVTKKDMRLQLDFNAIAKGYSVDVVAAFLADKGQQNFYIEIGGEIRVSGLNNDGKKWVLGIDEPVDSNSGYSTNRQLENYIFITDMAVATSGNYRKFYIKNGHKYSHTLNPKNGRPVEHNLLSATVICKRTGLADAYATAFMAMGVEKTMEFIEYHHNLEVYLLYENNLGKIERAYSDGMTDYISQ